MQKEREEEEKGNDDVHELRRGSAARWVTGIDDAQVLDLLTMAWFVRVLVE